MSFITTKFQEILLSGFSGVALTYCFSSIFHFGQISKFKKGVTPREKKSNQNFMWICTSTHYVLHNYKVSQNSVERFQRSCAARKTGLTEGRVKNIIPSTTRCVGYNHTHTFYTSSLLHGLINDRVRSILYQLKAWESMPIGLNEKERFVNEAKYFVNKQKCFVIG